MSLCEFLSPAEQLVGRVLTNGWEVTELLPRPKGATGGHFSASYIVQSPQGQQAFLKAMDYRKALSSFDPASALQIMTEAFNFERGILEKCRSNHLSRIVRVLDDGIVSSESGEPSDTVQYLIFELARGDVRSFVDFNQAFEMSWALRIIHQAAAGLQQLHSAHIAHQDLKPSNIIIFERHRSKLADLGRAYQHGEVSPHDHYCCAGDSTYAPPELLYGHISPDWKTRRLGCDLYLLGSLLVFFCAGVSMTHLLFARLDDEHRFEKWGGPYSDVLPYLRQIFAQVIRDFPKILPEGTILSSYHHDIVNRISEAIRQLCDPDPELRGHPRNVGRSDTRYSLERYVATFDLLVRKAEWSLMNKVPVEKLGRS
ncbi:MAG: protein kinase [Halieaceae bacterium]|nr:protein kinase [Halieaceae bacterium]